jgi:hypothetical protein
MSLLANHNHFVRNGLEGGATIAMPVLSCCNAFPAPKRVPNMEHIFNKCYQSSLHRPNRLISIPRIKPTCSMVTSAGMR